MSVRELEDEVRRCRSQGVTTTTRGDARGVSLEAAYTVQRELWGARPLKGYKLGLLSPAKQQQMGIDTPIYGRIDPPMLLESSVRLADFIQPRVEPELALVLAADVAAGASPAAARAAVGGFFLGVDVLDSVWVGYKFSAAEVVADNTSGGVFLLGGRLLDAPPEGELRLSLNGELVGAGPVSALGDPGERLSWLAAQVGGLLAGQTIFLGSPAAAQPAAPGLLEVAGPGGLLLTARLI